MEQRRIRKAFIAACSNGNIREAQRIKESTNLNVNYDSIFRDQTPLHVAIEKEHYDVVEFLLNSGAKLSFYTKESPLLKACLRGSLEITKLLIKKDPDIMYAVQIQRGNKQEDEDSIYESVFFHAMRNLRHSENTSYQKIVELLFVYGIHSLTHKGRKQKRFFQLCYYIYRNDIQAVEYFLDLIKDVDFKKLKEQSPLYYAVFLERYDIVKFLLKKGAQINFDKKLKRYGILHCAIERGFIHMVQLLLENGANINEDYPVPVITVEPMSVVPLYEAAQKCKLEMMKFLYNWGGRGFGFNGAGRSAVQAVVENGNLPCLQLLLENYQTVGTCDEFNKYLLWALEIAVHSNNYSITKFLLKNGANPNIPHNDPYYQGQNAFHIACLMSEIEIVQLLLNHGADPKILDYSGRSGLHFIISSSNESKMEMLLELIDINSQRQNGNTALHDLFPKKLLCSRYAMFLEYGADPSIKNHEGKIADEKFYDKFQCQCEKNQINILHQDCPLVRYYKKLRLLNYNFESLLQGGLRYIFDKDEEYKKEHVVYKFFNDNDADVQSYKNEIEGLKSIIIDYGSKATFYDFILMKPDRVVAYANNIILDEIYENCGHDFRKKFLHFGFALNLLYRKGQKRKNLLEPALEILDILQGYFVPKIISIEILKYLSKSELKKIKDSEEFLK